MSATTAQIKLHLQNALEEIGALMAQVVDAATPESNARLDQAGLRDGPQIVEEFLLVGEWGEALDHLCYMVEAAKLPISRRAYTDLKEAGAAMNFDVLGRYDKLRVVPDPPAA